MGIFKKHWKVIVIIILSILWVNSCSNSVSKSSELKENKVEIDSLKREMVNLAKFSQSQLQDQILLYQIETLKSEKRSVLNINQIFLRKKRPDDRVIEIDKEIEKLDKQLND